MMSIVAKLMFLNCSSCNVLCKIPAAFLQSWQVSLVKNVSETWRDNADVPNFLTDFENIIVNVVFPKLCSKVVAEADLGIL